MTIDWTKRLAVHDEVEVMLPSVRQARKLAKRLRRFTVGWGWMRHHHRRKRLAKKLQRRGNLRVIGKGPPSKKWLKRQKATYGIPERMELPGPPKRISWRNEFGGLAYPPDTGVAELAKMITSRYGSPTGRRPTNGPPMQFLPLGRGFGRTEQSDRRLLEGLCKGEKVLVMCPNAEQADMAYDKWLAALTKEDGITVEGNQKSKRTILLWTPTGGASKLEVRYPKDR